MTSVFPVTELRCSICGRSYDPIPFRYTCENCGDEGILEVMYDYQAASVSLQPSFLQANNQPGLARWQPILPLHSAENLPNLRVGQTPFYKAQRLGKAIGYSNLFVKDDGLNPTGSLKDRASAVCAASAREMNFDIITAASTGNAASSLAGMCASMGLKTIIFVPERAPKAKVAQLLMFGAQVLSVRGTYDDAFELSLKATQEFGWYNRNTGFNPYLLEGKKTAALEIWENMGYSVPDYVAVSVGDGCIIGGLGKGFLDLKRAGLIDKLPKLIGVQARGSSVLAKAFNNNDKVIPEPDADTYADSISVGLPRAASLALRGVHQSQGQFIVVEDDDIKRAQGVLAANAGVFAEPAGATPIAGLIKARAENLIPAEAKVVALITGNGLKDVEGAMKALHTSAVSIDKSPDTLKETLKELLDI
ncbi:MAG: threonine synthase [bacterium]|nr:threonine synthase [bacterium]